MDVQLNHTIVWCGDKHKSASFLVDLLELDRPVSFGPMLVVRLSNSVSLDFYEQAGKIALQHYAFLVGDADFARIFARINERKIEYWADPGRQRSGETYEHNGGRGCYFLDPDGHLLEVMTRPYALDQWQSSTEEHDQGGA